MSLSIAQRLAQLPPDQRDQILTGIDPAALLRDWKFWARPNQLAPPGDWLTSLILAGRGFGKTRAGAEWVLDRIEDLAIPDHKVALLARTSADARDVMVEGESGLVACARRRGWQADYQPSLRRVVITSASGHTATCTTYSSEEPDQLRGPQHHTAWVDEYAAHPDKRDAEGNTAYSNLLLGLRLGDDPRCVVTTTPKPRRWVRELVADPQTTITRGSTYDNLANLAPSFRKTVVAKYEGTRLGRQELMAELLDDVQGALWTGSLIEAHRVDHAPALSRIVVAVDPPATSTGDECGIVTVGKSSDWDAQYQQHHLYVLRDDSAGGMTPDQWGRRAVETYLATGADSIVIETNQGGDMAVQVITSAARALAAQGRPCRTVPIKRVHASRGKRTRAEPVSALYEQGLVHHVGTHPELEDQMTTWTADSGDSPDRMDALVWAVTDLALTDQGVAYQW